MIRSFLYFLFLIINFSCSFTETSSTNKTQEQWLTFHHVTDSDFEEVETSKYNPTEELYGLFDNEKMVFKSCFSYSPDSSYYIDMDSYGLEIFKNENEDYEYGGREVDSRVFLVKEDGTDSLVLELMFCGTMCSPEESYWVNNNEFVILGTSSVMESNKDYPTKWIYHLKDKTVRIKQVTKESEIRKENYFEVYKLKTVLANTEHYYK